MKVIKTLAIFYLPLVIRNVNGNPSVWLLVTKLYISSIAIIRPTGARPLRISIQTRF